MISLRTIWFVARYEAKVLMRAWSLRIFVLLILLVHVMMNIGMATNLGRVPYHFNAVSGFLPMMNMKMLNLMQGIVVAFLATDFIKRDRRHDSTEVVYARSMSNLSYVLGKMAGVMFVFALINVLIMALGLVFHALLSSSPFAWQPYILYPLLVSLPTLVFVAGVSFLLMTLLRSQALVFVIILGYTLLSLLFLQGKLYYVYDLFTFFQPLIYSDIIGLGEIEALLRVRGFYFLLGIAGLLITVLLLRRLRQSWSANVLAALGATVCALAAGILLVGQVNGGREIAERRDHLQQLSRAAAAIPTAAIADYDLEFQVTSNELQGRAQLKAINDGRD
jgi:ABC-type transport system involved in multi-copper enzyme maturation permease subunit